MRVFIGVVSNLAGILVTLTAFASAPQSNASPPISHRSPLAILAPESLPLPTTSVSPAAASAVLGLGDFFALQPTREASERLDALTREHEERVHYQTESQSQALDYMRANHELALSYLRALARGRVARFIRDSRQYLREQKQRSESVPVRANVVAEKAGAGSKHGSDQAPDETGVCCSRLFAQGWRFIEQLTNDGVTATLEPVTGTMRLNTQTTALSADLHFPVLDFNVTYRLLSPEHPLPFSGLSPDSQAERLVLSGSRTFPKLGLSGSFRYQMKSKNLNCAVTKTILGPVSGQLEQSRTLGGAGVLASSASLSMSLYF